MAIQARSTDVLHFGTSNKRANAFLTAYAELGDLAKAVRASGVPRQNHYHWLRWLDGYKDAFTQAEVIAADVMESEAFRRAVDGVEKPVHYKGERVDTVTEYSDTLLIFKLKGARPEKYKDNAAVQNLNITGPVQFVIKQETLNNI